MFFIVFFINTVLKGIVNDDLKKKRKIGKFVQTF